MLVTALLGLLVSSSVAPNSARSVGGAWRTTPIVVGLLLARVEMFLLAATADRSKQPAG